MIPILKEYDAFAVRLVVPSPSKLSNRLERRVKADRIIGSTAPKTNATIAITTNSVRVPNLGMADSRRIFN